MIANVEYIESRFEFFNHQLFGDELPKIKILLSDAGRFLGKFSCDIRRLPNGAYEHHNFKIRINKRIDLQPDQLDDVIVHEMIHYFIAYNNYADTAPHGKMFRAIMRRFNEEYGRNIVISQKNLTEQQKLQAISNRPVWHVIAEIELANGTLGVKVLPRLVDKVVRYAELMARSPRIKEVKLYIHNNPYFNRFPTSSALSYHPIDRSTFRTNISGARKILIDDKGFHVVNR